MTRVKASEIDFRVAQLDKEFTLNSAQRSGYWEEFEVWFEFSRHRRRHRHFICQRQYAIACTE